MEIWQFIGFIKSAMPTRSWCVCACAKKTQNPLASKVKSFIDSFPKLKGQSHTTATKSEKQSKQAQTLLSVQESLEKSLCRVSVQLANAATTESKATLLPLKAGFND